MSSGAAHDVWMHGTIQTIFKMCLVTEGHATQRYTTLNSLCDKIQGGKLNLENLEAALVDCLVSQTDSSGYLFGCWLRSKRLLDDEPKAPSHQHRVDFLSKIVKLTTSYFTLNVVHDDLFPNTRCGGEKLTKIMLHSSDASSLFDELLKNLREQDISQVFMPATIALSQEVKELSISDGWNDYLEVLGRFSSAEVVGKLIVQSYEFVPEGDGKVIEDRSILGPFFALSAANPRTMSAFLPVDDKGNVDKDYKWDLSTLQNVRGHWGLLMELLQNVITQILKPKQTRERLLQWFAAVLNSNYGRSKTQVDYKRVSSDCFMINFSYIMLQLFDPVIEKDSKTKESVFAKYVVSASSRLQYKGYTRIAMTDVEAKKLTDESEQQEWKFNTEALFFTYQSLHLGLLPSTVHWDRINQEIADLKQQLQQLDAQDAQAMMAGPLLAHQKELGQKLLNERILLKYVLDALLFDPKLVRSVFRFCNYAAMWLLRTAFGTQDVEFRGSLPDKVPENFAALPEFFVDSVADLLLTYLRHGPRFQAITHDLDVTNLIIMLVHFMPSSTFITNPYVRAKFPEILYVIAMIEKQVSRATIRSPIADVFQTTVDPAKLVPALMVLYCDMENLGGHNQFYEKFTPRYYIAELFNYLWDIPKYKAAFKTEATQKLEQRTSDHFVKFFNFLLNDANYLLEESLTYLKEIHEFEELYNNKAAWERVPATEQAEKEKSVAESKKRCGTYLRLGNETVNMMEYLSKDLPAPFLQPELADKVAAMLGYFLNMLAGKSLKELKVKNPRDYNFDHKSLIQKIAHTYLNFSDFKEFHNAVAMDGRSYNPESFDESCEFLKTKKLLNEMEQERFFELAAKIKVCYTSSQADEEMYGDDIPDHLLDPINYVLLTEPVQLPNSRHWVQRPVIVRHLLNDETDPFNRSPLTINDLDEYNKDPAVMEEAQKLMQEVEKWKQEKAK
mmetsp:Transcript_140655/g.244953  ORF Transcript_140655/g.244953 Transcript_140655/m.244953 type:complete len:956 (-) Transcript_140655:1043-3910(-)